MDKEKSAGLLQKMTEGGLGCCFLLLMVAPVYVIAFYEIAPTAGPAFLSVFVTVVAMGWAMFGAKGKRRRFALPVAFCGGIGTALLLVTQFAATLNQGAWIQGILTFGGVVLGFWASREVEVARHEFDVKREVLLGAVSAAASLKRTIQEASWKENQTLAPPREADSKLESAITLRIPRIVVCIARLRRAFNDSCRAIDPLRTEYLNALFRYDAEWQFIKDEEKFAQSILAADPADPENRKLAVSIFRAAQKRKELAKGFRTSLEQANTALTKSQVDAINLMAEPFVLLTQAVGSELGFSDVDAATFTQEVISQGLNPADFVVKK